MVEWISYYWLPLIFWIFLPGAAASVLASGLHRQRVETIPRRWWAVMIANFASPLLIFGASLTYAGDPIEGRGRSGEGLLFLLLALAALASPILLGTMTLNCSDRRDAEWRSVVAFTCLCVMPGTMMALLAAGQILSGVSM